MSRSWNRPQTPRGHGAPRGQAPTPVGRLQQSCRDIPELVSAAQSLAAEIDEIALIEPLLASQGLRRIASSGTAARKIHEAMTTILDRIIQQRSLPEDAIPELANIMVLAKYQAARRQISDCLAELVTYVVNILREKRNNSDELARVARRARLVFDSIIIAVK